MKPIVVLLTLSLMFLSSRPARAGEEDLFGDGGGSVDNQETPAVTLTPSGVMDFRFIRTGTAINWNFAGPGITRYGAIRSTAPLGSSTGLGPDASFQLSQVALDLDVKVAKKATGHVQLNYDDRPDTRGTPGSLGVVAAYIDTPINEDFSVRGGVVFPPISLEHPGPGWSTRYTLTPSAINTWVGEELRPIAVELRGTRNFGTDIRSRFIAALFSHNDPAGAILAWRGWALHDWQLKLGDRLRTRADLPPFYSSGFIAPFKEVDGRLGAYLKASADYKDLLGVEAFFSHTMGDPARWENVAFGADYAWRTLFWHLGVRYRPLSALTVLAQAMLGNSMMGATKKVNIDFRSWYVLVSYEMGDHRVTFRYDWFDVRDIDGTADINSQDGNAQTLAYLYSLSANQTLGAEYVRPTSIRPGTGGVWTGDAYDDLFQLNYRLTF